MSKNANDRKRARLHKDQNGKCYYCPDTVGILQTAKGFPVLEHYIPQHMGGTRVVLACKRCDKMKAMIPGPEFESIIKAHAANKTFNQAVQEMAAVCKARNIALAAAHAPNIAYMPRKYSKSHAPVEAVVVVALPSQTEPQAKREAFWASFKDGPSSVRKPSTGDQHYQGWTGKKPVASGKEPA